MGTTAQKERPDSTNLVNAPIWHILRPPLGVRPQPLFRLLHIVFVRSQPPVAQASQQTLVPP